MNLTQRLEARDGTVCSGCGQLVRGNYDALREHRVYVCDRSKEPRKARWLANPNAFGKALA